MARFPVAVAAAAGGMMAGLIFQGALRRSARAVAKSVVRGLSDGYQSIREDLDDLRAEVAAEPAKPQAAATSL
jgi:hypothetical protein